MGASRLGESSFRYELRTTIEGGPGCRSMLPGIVRGLGGTRTLLVTDQGLVRAGVAREVISLFEGAPGDSELSGVVDDVPQDARGETVNRLAAEYLRLGADSLVAVGGGSVLDAAKAARWLVGRGIVDIRDALTGNRGERWPKAQPIALPFVALPTTAGTGAEVSPIAVVLNERLGIKTNLISTFITPDFALLDAELTLGLPPRITAFTGFDALTHAIEAHFSPRSNAITDAYAREAIRIIVEELPRVVHHGDDLEARSRMLAASSMAILAFGHSLDAIPVHNMAHAFGGRFGIPHGLANAVLLADVMSALRPFYAARARSLGETLGLRELPDDPEACLDAVAQFLRDLRGRVGLPGNFAEFNLDPGALSGMVDLVHRDPAGVSYELPADVIERVTGEVSGIGS